MRRGQRDRARRIVVIGRRRGPRFDFIIENDAMWAEIPAELQTGGGRIGVAPGNYTTKTLTSLNPTSTLTFAATQPSSKPQISELTISGSSKIAIEDLELHSSYWAADGASKGCLTYSGTIADIAVRRCKFVSNYRGEVGKTDYDLNTDDVPEYACIRPVFDGTGAVVSFDRLRDFVGDLLADGTYSMVFSNYGGITFSVAPVASFTVSGGVITGTTLTSGGASNGNASSGAGIRTNLISWSGQRKMTEWMPSAWRTASPCNASGDLVFEDCEIDFCNHGFKPVFASHSGSVQIKRCDFDRVYQDYISLSGGYEVVIEDCFGTRPFSYFDAGDPHSDFVQLFWTGSQAADWENISIERNIFVTGSARGAVQGIILGDPNATYYWKGIRVVGNAMINTGNSSIDLETIRDGYIYRNLGCRFDLADGRNTAAATLSISGDTPLGTPFFGDNIGESVTAGTPGYSSVSLGLLGATNAYADVFANHTATRNSRSSVASAYTPKVAYAGKGPFADAAYINHASYTTNRSLEPTYVKFNSLANQTASSTVTSNWSKVQGGVSGAISVSNGRYRIADDASGTNATSWTASAGTVDPDKFVQAEAVNSGSGATTSTATVMIRGYGFPFESTTAPVTSFVSVDNQAAAYSATARPSNETGIKKVLLAVRFTPDAVTTNANIIAHTSAAVMRLWFASSTSLRFQLSSSTRCRLIPVFTPTVGQARTHIISLDFTNSVANQGCVWATDIDGVLLANSAGSGGTFDTRSTAGSGTDYGSATLDLTSVTGLFGSAGVWGAFREPDGGGTIFDGKIEMIFADWGGDSYVLPDITDATVRNKWTADLIGANGEGPTGISPKIYYTGSVADWNDAGGLANKGSLTLPLTKQAGTYV